MGTLEHLEGIWLVPGSCSEGRGRMAGLADIAESADDPNLWKIQPDSILSKKL